MPESGFLIFFNFFCFFFGIFLPGSRISGIRALNFFLCFLAYLIPFWLEILPERGFLIFLLNFSEFSCRGQVWTEFGTKIFFFPFSTYLIPFWLKIRPKSGFVIFWIFLQFSSEFSCSGRVWTEFGAKIFFSLSQPISSHFR